MFDTNEIDGLVHLYIDGAFSRRELVKRVARKTGGVAAALVALQAFDLPRASAQCLDDVRIPEGAADLQTQMVEFPGEAGIVFAYLARPLSPLNPPRGRSLVAATLPAVMVIHENRGLNEHTKDVTRRVARAGYVGLGIDLVSRQGGTHQYPDPQQAGQAYNRVGAAAYLQDMLSGLAYLKDHPWVQGQKLGAVGFCAGGQNCFTLAVSSPDLAAAVPYYPGGHPTAEQLDRLTAPVMAMYGQTDNFVNASIPAALTTLVARRKRFAMHIYEGAGHAFLTDTGPSYNRAAACDAWARTIAFFDRHLKDLG